MLESPVYGKYREFLVINVIVSRQETIIVLIQPHTTFMMPWQYWYKQVKYFQEVALACLKQSENYNPPTTMAMGLIKYVGVGVAL